MLKKITAAAVAIMLGTLTACGSSDSSSTSPGAGDPDKITLGFAQVGAESGWRTANTKSIQDATGAAGFELKFSDAQQKQENQIKAIRSFIQQKVDVIAFSPVVETGWDNVLLEAKRANIPVILTDRSIDSTDTTLYKSFLGSDFVNEGKEAGDWVAKEYASATGPVNIAVLEGTTGSAPANDRSKGFNDVIKADPKFKVVASQDGDFTRAQGKQVMESFLKSQSKIDVLFAQNDDMGLGALDAIKAAGLTPGKDIKIVTVDGTHDGLQALADGKFNYVVECNPLLGPQLMDLVKKVAAGQSVPNRILTKETAFDQAAAKAALPSRQY